MKTLREPTCPKTLKSAQKVAPEPDLLGKAFHWILSCQCIPSIHLDSSLILLTRFFANLAFSPAFLLILPNDFLDSVERPPVCGYSVTN